MKKVLYSMLGLGLLLTSCQSDEPFAPGESGEKQVTFTLNVPGDLGTRAGATDNNSAVGGFSNGQGTLSYTLVLTANGDSQTLTATGEDKEVVFTPTVVLGREYKVTAYAHFGDALTDLTNIVETKGINDESKDAYTWTGNINFATDGTEQELTLTRPYGKLRLIATDYNVEANNSKPITDVKSVTVTYNNDMYTVYNAVNGEFTTAAEKSFTNVWNKDYYEAATTEGAKTIFADYVSVNETGVAPFTITVEYGNGETYTREFAEDIPVKRNALTTLKGNFFTAGAEITVQVDEDFENTSNLDINKLEVVSNSDELRNAISKANNTSFTDIRLMPGTYSGAFDIDGKNVVLYAEDGDDVTIDGLVFGLGASHIHLRNLTLTNENPVASNSPRHKADYYCVGAYAAEFVIENCEFNVSNQGNAAGKGAINIGDGFNANPNEFELTVKNTVFNCNGERPIRAKTRSWIEGCTFNDQYRYSIQVQGNEQVPSEVVKFINNTIVDPCKTSKQPYFAGVSISGSQKVEDVEFVIEGNTTGAKFVYDNDNDINITSCKLNGNNIVDAQCVEINSVTDAKEILIVDNEVSTTEELKVALKIFDTIYLNSGEYDFANPVFSKDNVTIIGNDKENCILRITGQVRADNKSLTLKNLTTDVPTGLNYGEHNFAWIHYFKEFNMIDCKSNGRIRLNSYSANIENCEFNVTTSSGFDGYAIYYYGPDKSKVKVSDSEFNTVGKAIVLYNEGSPVLNLDVENCTFVSSDSSTDKAAIQMHTEYGITGTVNVVKCTATGFVNVNDGLWNELNNNTKVTTDNFDITVDGVQVH